eukprot:7078678-Prymnesium_polylepis.1
MNALENRLLLQLGIKLKRSKIRQIRVPVSGVSTSAPSGRNGLTRTVWTGVTHPQRFGSVGKRITRSRKDE